MCFCLFIVAAKNFFRVSSGVGGQSHCFQASDAFNKQQWINCIRQAKEAAAVSLNLTGTSPAPAPEETAAQGLDQTMEKEREAEEKGQGLGKEEEKDMEFEPEIKEEMETKEDGLVQDGLEEVCVEKTGDKLVQNGLKEDLVETLGDEVEKMEEEVFVDGAEMQSRQETEES